MSAQGAHEQEEKQRTIDRERKCENTKQMKMDAVKYITYIYIH